MGLRNEAKETPVTIEAPRTTQFNHVDTRLIMTIEENIGNAPNGILVREFECFRSVPLDAHHGD
jgi:hypothetical protein